ncbi:TolC family protein [Halioxenophilus aromaticivorans]|uniref:TolC family protein n=1 Tax=Halioxenophilus aromaticivorans TaxID=1306992 RepID=A0AAV3TZC3_9ALTE
MKKSLPLVFGLLFTGNCAALPLMEYLGLVAQAHPELQSLEARSEQYAADRQYAEGAYDTEFAHKTASRVTGYYDGIYSTQEIAQRLKPFNSEVFTQYRVSDGEFPVYEEQNRTLSEGEASVGLRISLLQNRTIDEDRYNILLAENDRRKWQQQIKIAQSEFYYTAILAYAEWAKASQYYRLSLQMLETTLNRRKGISTRVNTGDLARIVLTEFEIQLMQREITALNAEQTLRASYEQLRYFIPRDIATSPDQYKALVDLEFAWPSALIMATNELTPSSSHPAIQSKLVEVEKAEQELRLAENKLLPKMDLEVAVAKDFGSGPESLEEKETKVALKLSVPLRRTQAKAKKTKAEFKLRQVYRDLEALIRALNVSLAQTEINLEYSQKLTRKQRQQVALARELFAQEQKRFALGASDFFLLNTRETNAFKAQQDHLDAIFAVNKQRLALLKIQAALDHDFVQALTQGQ